jgi:hypothetical protein
VRGCRECNAPYAIGPNSAKVVLEGIVAEPREEHEAGVPTDAVGIGVESPGCARVDAVVIRHVRGADAR